MGVPFFLEIICFLTVYLTIGTAGLTLPLNQELDSPGLPSLVSLNVSDVPVRVLCTSSLIWTGSTGYDSKFTDDCYQAWRIFLGSDFALYKSDELEFLQRGVTPSHSGVPKMATPRRYIMSESLVHPEDQVMSLTLR